MHCANLWKISRCVARHSSSVDRETAILPTLFDLLNELLKSQITFLFRFQLTFVFTSQALGVPQDSTAALANYQHAAYLGHTLATLFAANLLYEQFTSGLHDDIVVVMDLYKQAALAGEWCCYVTNSNVIVAM